MIHWCSVSMPANVLRDYGPGVTPLRIYIKLTKDNAVFVNRKLNRSYFLFTFKYFVGLSNRGLLCALADEDSGVK